MFLKIGIDEAEARKLEEYRQLEEKFDDLLKYGLLPAALSCLLVRDKCQMSLMHAREVSGMSASASSQPFHHSWGTLHVCALRVQVGVHTCNNA